MLLQTDSRRPGGKCVIEEETSDKLIEEETSGKQLEEGNSDKLIEVDTVDKLKPVKCYIKEVNNNSEEETKEEPKHLLMNEKVALPGNPGR